MTESMSCVLTAFKILSGQGKSPFYGIKINCIIDYLILQFTSYLRGRAFNPFYSGYDMWISLANMCLSSLAIATKPLVISLLH